MVFFGIVVKRKKLEMVNGKWKMEGKRGDDRGQKAEVRS